MYSFLWLLDIFRLLIFSNVLVGQSWKRDVQTSAVLKRVCKMSELMYIKVHPKDWAWEREKRLIWNECVRGGVEGFCITQAYCIVSLFNWNVRLHFYIFFLWRTPIYGVSLLASESLEFLQINMQCSCCIYMTLSGVTQMGNN